MENKTTTFVVRLGWVRFRQGVLDPKGDAVSYDRLVCTCCVCPSMSTAGLTMCIELVQNGHCAIPVAFVLDF